MANKTAHADECALDADICHGVRVPLSAAMSALDSMDLADHRDVLLGAEIAKQGLVNAASILDNCKIQG